MSTLPFNFSAAVIISGARGVDSVTSTVTGALSVSGPIIDVVPAQVA